VDAGDAGVANGVLSMAAQLGSSIGQTLLIAIIGTSAAVGVFADSAWAAGVSAAVALALSTMIVYGDATA
jgi:hypothetical protein